MHEIPPITGVAEIVLSVSDLPAMRAFYRDVLGFPVYSELCIEKDGVVDPNGLATICFLTIKELQTPLGEKHPQLLALIDYKRHASAKKRLIGHDVQRSTLNHLAFEIPPESYDAHRDRLKSMELLETETEFPGMNAKAMFFRDPERNVLEFICRATA